MDSKTISRGSAVTRRAFAARLVSAACLMAPLAGVRSANAQPSAKDDELLRALTEPGHIGLMRHALAPGFSDPAGFVIDDCTTQRNLSEEGREQARRAGAALRAAGLSDARVYSSLWCRCLETARLLDFGAVTRLPALNSFFENRKRGEAQTTELRAWIAEQPLDAPLLLVTHQVNISGLTGLTTRSGELIVLRREPDNSLRVRGRVLAA